MKRLRDHRWIAATLCALGLMVAGCSEGTPPAEEAPSHGEHSGHKGPKHAGHDSPDKPRLVKLSQKAQERYKIETKNARGGRLSSHVSAPATVQFAPDRKQHVSPLVRGRISELKVTVGDTVKKGETLAVLRSIELGKARAAVQAAKSDLKIATSNFERVEKLNKKGIVSERRFLEAKQRLESARAALESARSELDTYGVSGGSGPYYTLESDIAGRIIKQTASEGEVRGPSETLFVVGQADPVWVIADVFERDIAKVERGMEASVTLEAYPSRTWRGTVDWVADTVDSKTRTLRARIELPNPDGTLRPGMFGAVHLTTDPPDKLALVPVGAVQKVDEQQVIFTPADEPRHYRAQPVETGAEEKGLSEIRSGLKPGATYVTRGAFDLRATLTASSRSGGHHH